MEGVRQRNAVDLTGKRPEGLLVRHVLGRHRHGEVCTSVVAVLEHHHGLTLGVGAGDLDGVLHSLGAGVEQCRALLVVAGGQAVECLTHLDVTLIRRDHEAGVGELGDLLLDGFDDGGRSIADIGHGNTGTHVDQRVSVDVDEDASASTLDIDGQGCPNTLADCGDSTGLKLK